MNNFLVSNSNASLMSNFSMKLQPAQPSRTILSMQQSGCALINNNSMQITNRPKNSSAAHLLPEKINEGEKRMQSTDINFQSNGYWRKVSADGRRGRKLSGMRPETQKASALIQHKAQTKTQY